MAIGLSGTDSFFQRFGRIEDLRAKIKTHQDLITTEIADILAEYTADYDLAQNIQPTLESMKASSAAPNGALRQAARKTLTDMVDDDNTMPSRDIRTIWNEMISQMIGSGTAVLADDDINANTVSASQTSFSGTGNGAVVIDVSDNQDVLNSTTIQTTRPEDIVLKCTRDTQVTGTASRDETFSIQGERAVPNPDDVLWPGGSGINTSLRVLSSAEDGRDSVNRTLVVNGDMENFATTNNLDNWTAVVGAYGTNILEEGTNVHRGSKALEIVGDAGATLTYLEQKFNTSGQSTAKLKPLTKYVMAVALRDSGAGLLAGTIRISVQDDSDDSLIASTASAISKAFSDTTTSYQLFTTVFNTPLVLPTTSKIVIELTTACTNTESFFIDDLILAPMAKMGPGDGPSIAIIPGSTNFIQDDKFIWAVANNQAGGLMQGLDRIFNLHSLVLRPQVPADLGGAETITDNDAID